MLRKIAELADRRPFRPLLAMATSQLAGQNLGFEYDGSFWLYRTGGHALPHTRNFAFYKDDIERLPRIMKRYIDEANDCWFHLYKPCLGHTIVDVGAEIGSDTIVFSEAVGPAGKVYAIEAHPQTYQLLLSTCAANSLSNVIPLQMAVADKPGTVHISIEAGIESNFLCDDGEPVEADSLDNMLRDVPRIDLLKMNIEGAERLAILGMDETIMKTRHLAIACHDFVGAQTGNDWFNTRALVETYLTERGFEVYFRDDDPREYVRFHLHAIPRAG